MIKKSLWIHRAFSALAIVLDFLQSWHGEGLSFGFPAPVFQMPKVADGFENDPPAFVVETFKELLRLKLRIQTRLGSLVFDDLYADRIDNRRVVYLGIRRERLLGDLCSL